LVENNSKLTQNHKSLYGTISIEDNHVFHLMQADNRIGILSVELVEGFISISFNGESGYHFSTEVPIVRPKVKALTSEEQVYEADLALTSSALTESLATISRLSVGNKEELQ
jgi:hypothetical protein